MNQATLRTPDTNPRTDGPSDAQKVFLLTCMDAYRDGRIDPQENSILRRLHHALGLSSDEARKVAAAARVKASQAVVDRPDSLDPRRVYLAVYRVLSRHDGLNASRQGLLDTLASVLGLERSLRDRLEQVVIERRAERASQHPAPADPVEAPVEELPGAAVWSGSGSSSRAGLGSGIGGTSSVHGKKKEARDTGGKEDAIGIGDAYGDPAAWGFFRPLSLAFEVTARHPGYWIFLAGILVMAGWIPFVGFVVPAAGTILCIGAAVDMLHGESDPEVSRTWGRWRERLWPAFWTSFLCGILGLGFVGITALSLAISDNPVWWLVVGTVALFAGLSLFRAVIFATQEVVLAGQSGTDALQGSFRVAHPNIASVIGTVILIGGFTIAGTVAMAVFALPLVAIAGEGLVANLGLKLVGSFAQQLVGQVGSVAWTYAYLRERARVR